MAVWKADIFNCLIIYSDADVILPACCEFKKLFQ